MGDLNESGINDPAMPNAQDEGAFNNPTLSENYRRTINRNFPEAKRAQITQTVQEKVATTEPCTQCAGSGHYKGEMCPGCNGEGRIAPEDARLL